MSRAKLDAIFTPEPRIKRKSKKQKTFTFQTTALPGIKSLLFALFLFSFRLCFFCSEINKKSVRKKSCKKLLNYFGAVFYCTT